MGQLKLASVVFAFAAVSLAVGAGAFSSVSADRGVEVAVVDDEEAMLGIETVGGDDVVESDNPPHEQRVMEFHNRFGEDIALDVTVHEPAGKPKRKSSRLAPSDGALAPGGDATLYAEINCNSGDPPPSETWTVSVTAVGETVSVRTSTEVAVECTGEGDGTGSTETTE